MMCKAVDEPSEFQLRKQESLREITKLVIFPKRADPGSRCLTKWSMSLFAVLVGTRLQGVNHE